MKARKLRIIRQDREYLKETLWAWVNHYKLSGRHVPGYKAY